MTFTPITREYCFLMCVIESIDIGILINSLGTPYRLRDIIYMSGDKFLEIIFTIPNK